MRCATAFVLSAVSIMPTVYAAPPADPGETYLCNFASVKLSTGTGTLNVRDAPRGSGHLLTHLATGTTIYICDETRYWFKVRFGGPTSPCGAKLKGGIAVSQTNRCESGWVSKQFVEVLSG